MWHWVLHVTGADNLSGPWYGFWSGFGSDLGEFGLFGALAAHYRRHTCHVNSPRFCWRPGVHPVAGTPLRACRKHHPQVPDRVTAEHIAGAAAEVPDGVD